MKKMIAGYLIQVVFLGTFILVSIRIMRRLEVIDYTLMLILKDQSSDHRTPFDPPIKVEIVNTPSVRISGTASVSVDNEPDVHAHIAP